MDTLGQSMTDWEDRLDVILAEMVEHVVNHSDPEPFGLTPGGIVPSLADALRCQFLGILAAMVHTEKTMPVRD